MRRLPRRLKPSALQITRPCSARASDSRPAGGLSTATSIHRGLSAGRRHVLPLAIVIVVLTTSTMPARMPPPSQAVRPTASKSHGPIGKSTAATTHPHAVSARKGGHATRCSRNRIATTRQAGASHGTNQRMEMERREVGREHRIRAPRAEHERIRRHNGRPLRKPPPCRNRIGNAAPAGSAAG